MLKLNRVLIVRGFSNLFAKVGAGHAPRKLDQEVGSIEPEFVLDAEFLPYFSDEPLPEMTFTEDDFIPVHDYWNDPEWVDHDATANGIGPVCRYCHRLIDWSPTDHALDCSRLGNTDGLG